MVKFLKKEKGFDIVAEELKKGGFVAETTLYELFYVLVRDFQDQGLPLPESLRRGEEIIDSLSVHMKKQNLVSAIMRQAITFKIQYTKHNLSHFDCLALGTAAFLQEPLLSGEKGLREVKEVKVFG